MWVLYYSTVIMCIIMFLGVSCCCFCSGTLLCVSMYFTGYVIIPLHGLLAVVEALEDERNLVIAGKKNRADMAREPNSAQVVVACGWET